MIRQTCQYKGALGVECGKSSAISVWFGGPLAEQPEFEYACKDHRGELSREWPNHYFWEYTG